MVALGINTSMLFNFYFKLIVLTSFYFKKKGSVC